MKPGSSSPPARSTPLRARERRGGDHAAMRPPSITTRQPVHDSPSSVQHAAVEEARAASERLGHLAQVRRARRDRARARAPARWPCGRRPGSAAAAAAPDGASSIGRAARRAPPRPAQHVRAARARSRRRARRRPRGSRRPGRTAATGKPPPDQRHRAVAHLGGAEGLGVQPAGLLELERGFLRDAEAQAARRRRTGGRRAASGRRAALQSSAQAAPASRAAVAAPRQVRDPAPSRATSCASARQAMAMNDLVAATLSPARRRAACSHVGQLGQGRVLVVDERDDERARSPRRFGGGEQVGAAARLRDREERARRHVGCAS